MHMSSVDSERVSPAEASSTEEGPLTEQGPPAHDSLRESWFYFMRCIILWGPLSHSNIDSPDSFYEFTYRDRGTSRRGMQSLVRRRLDLWEPKMYRQRQTNYS